MQQLMKTILTLLIHPLSTLQSGLANQNCQDNSLIKGYCKNEKFDLEKLVKDSKNDRELSSRLYQSFKSISDDDEKEEFNIASKILRRFNQTGCKAVSGEITLYKCLLKIVIKGILDEIKYVGYSCYFHKSSRPREDNRYIFNLCLSKNKINIKKEYFVGAKKEKLNFEKFLIVCGFDYDILNAIFDEKLGLNILNEEKVFKLIRSIKDRDIQEDLKKLFCSLIMK